MVTVVFLNWSKLPNVFGLCYVFTCHVITWSRWLRCYVLSVRGHYVFQGEIGVMGPNRAMGLQGPRGANGLPGVTGDPGQPVCKSSIRYHF